MSTREQALVFQVADSPVVGVLHSPSHEPKMGIIMVPAGGPQYHVGCCRQLLAWGRRFAEAGIAVLRFDYRGMGDSGGEFLGFEHIDDDLRAAVDELTRHHPELQEVALWGGCNAASAAMMYAWRDPRVGALIMLNPWAHTEATEARIQVKHYYLQRLKEKSFWKKLLKGGMDIRGSLGSLLDALKKARGTRASDAPGQAQAADDWPSDGNFVEKMRLGLERFPGEMLLLLSGQSLMGREFDETVSASRPWQQTVARARITRRELPEAGHTFSTREAQEAAFRASLEWLRSRNR